MLIALFERAVGLYASLVNVNAYHQPGVEAGKKAALEVLTLQHHILEVLKSSSAKDGMSVEQIAQATGQSDASEHTFRILRHFAANGRLNVTKGKSIFEDTYKI